MGDWAWVLVMLLGCAGLVVLARRIEPHWSTPDGTSFTCFTQTLGADGRPSGRWREGRAELVEDRVRIRRRLFAGFTREMDTLRIVGRSQPGRSRKDVFVLEGSGGGYVALRLPRRSPAVARLDALTP